MNKSYYSADGTDFRRELVGRSIVGMTRSSVELDNGTVLNIEEGGGCCSWFSGEFRAVNLSENVITRVEEVDFSENEDYNSDKLFTINIYSALNHLASVDVEGNMGSGYYGSSITLVVSKKEETGV